MTLAHGAFTGDLVASAKLEIKNGRKKAMTHKSETIKRAWPVLEEEDIQLIKEIYLTNAKHLDLDYMIRNPYSGYVHMMKVLVLVQTNSCREIIEDYHLWDELTSEITSYMIKFDETSEEFKKAEELWNNLQWIKNINREER